MIPTFGAISDRIWRKNTFFFGAGVIVVSAWPIFALIQTGQQWGIIVGVAIFLALGHAAVYSVLPAFYCELFPTEVRYTGISVGTRQWPFSSPASRPSSPRIHLSEEI